MKENLDIIKSIKGKGMKVSWVIDNMPSMNRKKFYAKCKENDWNAVEMAELRRVVSL